MILVIDNYDSFTYNLVQCLGSLGAEIEVYRNDRITIPEILTRTPSHLVLSPGPGRPENAGVTVEAIQQLAGRLPILGVCLGHQAIAHAFGGRIVNAPQLVHGKTSRIEHRGEDLFRGLPSPFEATRYHSLLVERESLPASLSITAETGGLIMGITHQNLPVYGVQFHPESILTPDGNRLLENFLKTRVKDTSGENPLQKRRALS